MIGGLPIARDFAPSRARPACALAARASFFHLLIRCYLMKFRLPFLRSKTSSSPTLAATTISAAYRSPGKTECGGLREMLRFSAHASLAGAVFLGGMSPYLRACEETEYHVLLNNYGRDPNGCLVTQLEYWNQTWNPSTGTLTISGHTFDEPEITDCPPPAVCTLCEDEDGNMVPDPDSCGGANPFHPADGNVTRDILDLKVPGAAAGRFDWGSASQHGAAGGHQLFRHWRQLAP